MSLSSADASASPEKHGLLQRFRTVREARIGLTLTLVIGFIILFGPLMAPFTPTDINLGPANSGPGMTHLLGTDHLGRDVLSRLLWGGQTIVVLPLLGVSCAYAVALLIATVAAYKGGLTDVVVSRVFEIMMTLPGLIVTLLLVATFGPGTKVLLAAIAISSLPGAARVVRAAVLSQIGMDYISAAQARGETTLSIALREIAPNILGTVVADFTLRMTWAILGLSTLSFLGLGVQPPTPDWGLMIQEARSSLQSAPLACLAPAAAIALLSVGLSLTGDAIAHIFSGETGGH